MDLLSSIASRATSGLVMVFFLLAHMRCSTRCSKSGSWSLLGTRTSLHRLRPFKLLHSTRLQQQQPIHQPLRDKRFLACAAVSHNAGFGVSGAL